MVIHPKTSAASLGGALGVVIVAILHSISGIHLTPEADAAIPTFLASLGAFLAPSPQDTAPSAVATVPPADTSTAGGTPTPPVIPNA